MDIRNNVKVVSFNHYVEWTESTRQLLESFPEISDDTRKILSVALCKREFCDIFSINKITYFCIDFVRELRGYPVNGEGAILKYGD